MFQFTASYFQHNISKNLLLLCKGSGPFSIKHWIPSIMWSLTNKILTKSGERKRSSCIRSHKKKKKKTSLNLHIFISKLFFDFLVRIKTICLILPRFELSISWLQKTIYFHNITMPKKSHFTVFVIQNFVQNMKKHLWIPFNLLGSCLWMVFSWLFSSWI